MVVNYLHSLYFHSLKFAEIYHDHNSIAAWLHDITGVYASAFYLAGVLLISSAAMMLPTICGQKSPKVT